MLDNYGNYYRNPSLDSEDESAKPQSKGTQFMNGVVPKRITSKLKTADEISQAAALKKVKTQTRGEELSNAERQNALAMSTGHGANAPSSGFKRADDGSWVPAHASDNPSNNSGGDTKSRLAAFDEGQNMPGPNEAIQDDHASTVPQTAAINPTPAPTTGAATGPIQAPATGIPAPGASPLQPSPATPSSSPVATATQGQGSTQGDSAAPAVNPTWNPKTGNSWDANNPQEIARQQRLASGFQAARDSNGINSDGSVTPSKTGAAAIAPRPLNQKAAAGAPSSPLAFSAMPSTSALPKEDDEEAEASGAVASASPGTAGGSGQPKLEEEEEDEPKAPASSGNGVF